MSSMGMDKSGSQTIGTSGFIKLTTFTVRSGYPSTNITNSTLVMDTTGTGTLRYNVTFSSSFSQQMRVVKNGSTVVDGPVSANANRTSPTISIAPGDTLELQASSSSGGAFNIVNAGVNTFLEYNQLTSQQPMDASSTVTNTRTATAALQRQMQASQTVTAGLTAQMNVQGQISAPLTVTAGRTAAMYKGQFYNMDAALTVTAGRTADMIKIPKPTPLPSVFDVSDVSMSVHTVDGRMIGDFPCNIVTAFQWGREQNEVSTASYDVGSVGGIELAREMRPWVHWTTIWHDGEPVWTGPVQSIKGNRNIATISARDTATFMWRTRVPITRTWVDTHTENIAFDLWEQMLQLHSIRATPVVLAEVVQKSFTITAKAEQRMLNQLMDDLAKVGLIWTVVAGRPVLGVFSRDPVVSLEECDIMAELTWLRDGTATYNDVRVQGQNWAQNAVADLAGLRLQTLVQMDDMFGASNIQRATIQYAQDSARIRDQLVVPGSASLHPNAPVSLADLIPGKVWAVHTEDASQLMRLDQVNVVGSPGSIDVQVGLVALEEKDEIARLVGGGGAA